jgi:NAD(P)H-dependent FMN reductase
MSAAAKLAFLAGSTRRASFNRKLARVACDLARERGHSADLIELADYPMPLYNGALVLPGQIALSRADKAIDDAGGLVEATLRELLAGVVEKLGQAMRRLGP